CVSMAGEHNALNATAAAALAAGQGVPAPAIAQALQTFRSVKRRLEVKALADMVVLAGVFKSESIPEYERLDPSHVVRGLRERGIPAALYQDADVIVSALSPEVHSGDVIAILSNGGFGGIYQKLPRGITEAAIAGRLA